MRREWHALVPGHQGGKAVVTHQRVQGREVVFPKPFRHIHRCTFLLVSGVSGRVRSLAVQIMSRRIVGETVALEKHHFSTK
jgi:hypothetical protein